MCMTGEIWSSIFSPIVISINPNDHYSLSESCHQPLLMPLFPVRPLTALCGSSLWFKHKHITQVRKTSWEPQRNRITEEKHVQVLLKKLQIPFSLTPIARLILVNTCNHFQLMFTLRERFCDGHRLLNRLALLCSTLFCNSVLYPLTPQWRASVLLVNQRQLAWLTLLRRRFHQKKKRAKITNGGKKISFQRKKLGELLNWNCPWPQF